MSEYNGAIINVEKNSSRLEYLFHWLFADFTEWRYAVKGEIFKNRQKLLNYASIDIPGALNIAPTHWMFESHLRMPKHRWLDDHHPKLLLDDNDYFDPVAAIFFLISRVEEYTPALLDLHGRFPSNASINHPFLLVPLADVWRQEIHCRMGLQQPMRKTKVHFSFDIDSAFAYKHKGFARTVGAMGRDLLSLQFRRLTERILCVGGFLKDPFDTYDRVMKDCLSRGIELSWFFLLSDRTEENNNIHHSSKGLQKLIQHLAQQYTVGIHPGYDTWKDEKLLHQEVSRLSDITSRSVVHSRQHYLRFSIPDTYRVLHKLGIRHEYSMGYADTPGFRAGTSLPFRWFDLQNNQVTDLTIHPFCAMDVTFSRYQKISPNESIAIIEELIKHIENTGGHFHMLWHNETLSARDSWRGWEIFWSYTLQSISSND